MPTTHDPASGRSEKKATGIYIARGADTLGPYNPAEAAALVVGGYLQADDFAARNGDSAWVPLAEFLPPSFRQGPAQSAAAPAAPPPGGRSPRWWPLALAILALAAAPFLVAWGVGWYEGRLAAAPAAARPVPTQVPTSTPAASPAPTLAAVTTPAAAVPPPAPAPESNGPLRGALDAPQAGVQVAAYPLEALEAALAPTLAAAHAARERLDPSINAAAAELSARAAEEETALKALNDAASSDPLRRSLRFAYDGARTATRTAADNARFLREERTAAAGGETLFRALPTPAVTTGTDPAGSFTLDLPPDGQPYAVAASVPQTAPDGSVRVRRWLVRLSDGQRNGHMPLRLDDDNALSSASADSVVHAAD